MTDNWVSRERRVEARQVSWATADEIAVWCGGTVVTEIDENNVGLPGINVPTISGVVRASEGDYIVKNPSGTFQKMSRYAFETEFIQVICATEMAEKYLDDAPKSLDPRDRWRTL